MFDMPAVGTWEQRGAWVVKSLSRDLSLTPEQAAGVVGNLGFESRGFTAFHEDGQAVGKGGYGWAQWTADRRVSYFSWCRAMALEPRSDEANYRFLCAELKGGYSRTIAALRECKTLEEAVWSVGQTYERPGGTTENNLPGYAGRLGYARRALSTGDRMLQIGDSGDDVRELQRLLTQAGSACTVDGRFGNDTRDAVMEFQDRHESLSMDGVVGPATWAELRKAAGK